MVSLSEFISDFVSVCACVVFSESEMAESKIRVKSELHGEKDYQYQGYH